MGGVSEYRINHGLEHCRWPGCDRRDTLTFDHIKPYSVERRWRFENTTILCHPHNQEKDNAEGSMLRSLAAEEADAPPERRWSVIGRRLSGLPQAGERQRPVIPVRLTIEEYAHAVEVGMRRRLDFQCVATTTRARMSGRGGPHPGGDGRGVRRVRVRKAYGSRRLPGTFHGTPDAGGIEVRACHRDSASLIIRDNDADGRGHLVTGDPPEMMVRGCIRGRDAKRDAWVRNPHGHRRGGSSPPKPSDVRART